MFFFVFCFVFVVFFCFSNLMEVCGPSPVPKQYQRLGSIIISHRKYVHRRGGEGGDDAENMTRGAEEGDRERRIVWEGGILLLYLFWYTLS